MTNDEKPTELLPTLPSFHLPVFHLTIEEKLDKLITILLKKEMLNHIDVTTINTKETTLS